MSRSSTLIAVSIIVGSAFIACALYFALDNEQGEPAATTSNVASSVQVGESVSAPGTSNSTCTSWRTTKAALDAIPGLPLGWNYETPNIDVYIGNTTNAIERALDLFEPKIDVEPADVAAAATEYVALRRLEIEMLRAQTYTHADGVAGNMALSTLDELCGT